jgi:hypothetical protein
MFKYFREQLARHDDGLRRQQMLLARARTVKAEVEGAKLKGLLIEREVIGPALRNLSGHMRATLQRKLEQELGPNLAGKGAVEILEAMRGAVDDICGVFEGGARAWME